MARQRALPWTYDDGGREAAGFTERVGDCVVRAMSIATEADPALRGHQYAEIHRLCSEHTDPDSGVGSGVYEPILQQLGWAPWWWPQDGTGRGGIHRRSWNGMGFRVGAYDVPVHLPRVIVVTDVLMAGVAIYPGADASETVRGGHMVAVIDGVVRDVRGGVRGQAYRDSIRGFWVPLRDALTV